MENKIEKREFWVRWSEFNMKNELIQKERVFDTSAKREAFVKKFEDKCNFNRVESWYALKVA